MNITTREATDDEKIKIEIDDDGEIIGDVFWFDATTRGTALFPLLYDGHYIVEINGEHFLDSQASGTFAVYISQNKRYYKQLKKSKV